MCGLIRPRWCGNDTGPSPASANDAKQANGRDCTCQDDLITPLPWTQSLDRRGRLAAHQDLLSQPLQISYPQLSLSPETSGENCRGGMIGSWAPII
jgi:hypothetical protein